MPVFQFGGWPSGAHLASYLYQDLSISAILWLQREDPVGYRYCEYDQVPQKTLERRAARQLEQYRQSEGVFTMSRWLSEFLIRECRLPGKRSMRWEAASMWMLQGSARDQRRGGVSCLWEGIL